MTSIVGTCLQCIGIELDVAHLKALVICILIVVGGGVGGITGGKLREVFGYSPALTRWRDAPLYFLTGAAAAFAVVVLFRGLGIVPERLNIVHRDVYYAALTFVAGVFSMRLIRSIGSILEKRLNELSKEIDQAKTREKEITNEMNKARAYGAVLMKAQTAMLTRSEMDLEDAIRYVREAIVEYPLDRTLNVFCARMLRLRHNYTEAISLLREFADKIEMKRANGGGSEELLKAGAVAHYNSACYYCCMVERNQANKDELLASAKQELRKAILLDARYAREVSKDEDLVPYEKELMDGIAL